MATARWPAFRHRNFRIFFVGQLASLVGTWMQQAAQLWLVYRLTGSPSLLGLIGFATQGPIFLLGTLGGVVSDSFDRRRVLLVTQGLSMLLAFVLAALTVPIPALGWEPRIDVGQILTVALLLGIVNAFDTPTRQAFVGDLVGQSEVVSAVALNSSTFHAARIVGPAVGGLVIAQIGEGGCFFANGLSFLAVLVSLLAIRLAPRADAAAGTRRRLVDGLRFVFHDTVARSLLLLLGLVSLAGASYTVLLPVFARTVLHVDARGLGLLMGAAGVGSLTAALRLSVRAHARGLHRSAVASAALAGSALLAFSQSRTLWLSLAALVPVGFAITTQLASTNTVLQTTVPHAMRGRVMSVYAMMFMGTLPFGQLLVGTLAEHVGVSRTVAAGGVLCLMGAALAAVLGRETFRQDWDDTATRAESDPSASG